MFRIRVIQALCATMLETAGLSPAAGAARYCGEKWKKSVLPDCRLVSGRPNFFEYSWFEISSAKLVVYGMPQCLPEQIDGAFDETGRLGAAGQRSQHILAAGDHFAQLVGSAALLDFASNRLCCAA